MPRKIGLVDVDGRNYPNLALMKISAHHKAQGDEVVWYDPMFTGHCDKVYLSKVNQFRLFQKVYLMEPKVMLKKDILFFQSF